MIIIHLHDLYDGLPHTHVNACERHPRQFRHVYAEYVVLPHALHPERHMHAVEHVRRTIQRAVA